MKAMVFHQYGDPDVLQYGDVETPEPRAGEVRVRVAGTTFNGVDGNIRAGLMQEPMPLTLPHILGVDVAGTVDSQAKASTPSRSVTASWASCRSSATARPPSTSSSTPPASLPLRPASRSATPPPCRWSG
ncbi:hypothetical protein GCM10022242_19860 [Nocardioides panacisoli]|uniref:Alcohol dehydrogenase-like N-terminal domain-containing protein n=1 Tax=Nocardioides panacisoli TaxID=627624 RepID=A0ABP7IGL9_9ACTN